MSTRLVTAPRSCRFAAPTTELPRFSRTVGPLVVGVLLEEGSRVYLHHVAGLVALGV